MDRYSSYFKSRRFSFEKKRCLLIRQNAGYIPIVLTKTELQLRKEDISCNEREK